MRLYDRRHDSHKLPSRKTEPKKQKILEFLENNPETFYPREIAEKLGFNPSTVRNYLRNLLKEGLIKRLEGGRYCSNVTYGVVVPLLLHDVHFRIEAPFLRDMGAIPDVDEYYGDCHLKIRFGKKRGQITGFIAYDKGMDKAHVLMLMRRIYELVERKTGHKVEKFRITTLDWNRDFYGKRIDNKFGIRCFTIGEFEDFLTRIYQKDEFTVRVEAKTSRELTIDELLEIQRTGSIGYLRDGEMINQLMSRLDNQNMAIRFMNRKIAEITDALEVFAEGMREHMKLIKTLQETTEALREAIKEMKRG